MTLDGNHWPSKIPAIVLLIGNTHNGLTSVMSRSSQQAVRLVSVLRWNFFLIRPRLTF
jgi:hypothetical protein